MPHASCPPQARRAADRFFTAAVWLAIVLVGVKACYLHIASDRGAHYVSSLAAISYVDVVFAAAVWASARAALSLAGTGQVAERMLWAAFLWFSAFSCLYALANVLAFPVFGAFLTYPLVALIGDVRMIRSSVAAQLTRPVLLGLVCVPLVYLALVHMTNRLLEGGRASRLHRGIVIASLVAWVGGGAHAFAVEWAWRQDHRIAESLHWVFLTSWWRASWADATARMSDRFPNGDLADFEPIGLRLPPAVSAVFRRASSAAQAVRTKPARRPPNVILIVLESVAARWTSLNGGPYATTPMLAAEAKQGLVFENFYAHIGRSSNSLAAVLLSAYPKLGFRELTQEYPRLPGTSLAALFRDRAYRTAFVTPSDLSWADWETFLAGRGFGDVRDYHRLSCSDLLSSWGVEDRCMVDAMIDFIGEEPARPFFLMGWTQQTHHPYEPTPGVPSLDLLREPVPDDYDLGRYLNVLHETDRQLGRLFDAVRRARLADDTLIVITGDHGQAFGYPHDSYIQGRTIYEEDVHIPLMLWFPRVYTSAMRSPIVGSHVDLAPTIAELVGLPSAPDWQGRSLFDARHPPRAYFYVAEDHYRLGLRDGNWKYIFDLRQGIEELYDLDRDPTEQHNRSGTEQERCVRLRQRLAAWVESNRQQYDRVSRAGP